MRLITLTLLLPSFGLALVGLTKASPALAPARDLISRHELGKVDTNPHHLLPRQTTTTVITNENAQDAPRTSCGFDGDSDTYGLGIRVGVYTQWASGVIANWYVTEMAHTMRIRATLFQMAMTIALAFITIRKPRPYAVDAMIMIVILLGSASCLTSHVIRPQQWKHTTLGGRMRFLFFFLLSMYASWFWWTGMDRFKSLPPQPSHCSGLQYGFFFHRTNLFVDWYRKTNFALAVTAASLTGIVFVGFAQHYHQMLWNELHAAFKTQTSGDFGGLLAGMEDGVNEPAPQEPIGPSTKALDASKDKFLEKNPPWWKPALAGAAMLLAIIAVELVISWNNIQGVNTILNTGQLIPFVIGLGGLGKICFRWWQLETVKKVVGPGSPGVGAAPTAEKIA